jgi:alpha-1,3-mannosyltransferase
MIDRLKRAYVSLAATPVYDIAYIGLLLIMELGLNVVVIRKVAYTEIDWEAYMQEVEFWLDGELDYRKIYGGTGPLVYPAGFLYLFAWLRKLTNSGNDIQTAQYIFAAFYVGTQFAVLLLYQQILSSWRRRKVNEENPTESPVSVAHHVWSWRVGMAVLCLSKRIHSIFVLRLFNDGPTMLLLYISMLLFTWNRWNVGCVVFSMAVSIKMNVLLFAPGLLLLLLQVGPDAQTVALRLGLGCALPQLILGAPFLTTYPVSYLRKAFELDRVFFYKWTVNFKFLPEEVFLSKGWAKILVALHVGTLAFCATQQLAQAKRKTSKQIFLLDQSSSNQNARRISPEYVVYIMFLSNFIGIAFARTLHYQFYCWYFHGLPYLLWSIPSYPLLLKIVIMGCIEAAFLSFPATSWSSAILQIAHLAILLPSCVRSPSVVQEITKSKGQ